MTIVDIDGGRMTSASGFKMVRLSHEYVQVTLDGFLQLLSSNGWVISTSLLGSDEWRCSWSGAKVE